MNKENIKKWLDALASGEFQQASRCLNAGGNQRCCLGVACDVYMRETGNGHWIERKQIPPGADRPVGESVFKDAAGYEDQALPDTVKSWLGLTESNPVLDMTGFSFSTVAEANDNGVSWDEIIQLLKYKYHIE